MPRHIIYNMIILSLMLLEVPPCTKEKPLSLDGTQCLESGCQNGQILSETQPSKVPQCICDPGTQYKYISLSGYYCTDCSSNNQIQPKAANQKCLCASNSYQVDRWCERTCGKPLAEGEIVQQHSSECYCDLATEKKYRKPDSTDCVADCTTIELNNPDKPGQWCVECPAGKKLLNKECVDSCGELKYSSMTRECLSSCYDQSPADDLMNSYYLSEDGKFCISNCTEGQSIMQVITISEENPEYSDGYMQCITKTEGLKAFFEGEDNILYYLKDCESADLIPFGSRFCTNECSDLANTALSADKKSCSCDIAKGYNYIGFDYSTCVKDCSQYQNAQNPSEKTSLCSCKTNYKLQEGKCVKLATQVNKNLAIGLGVGIPLGVAVVGIAAAFAVKFLKKGGHPKGGQSQNEAIRKSRVV